MSRRLQPIDFEVAFSDIDDALTACEDGDEEKVYDALLNLVHAIHNIALYTGQLRDPGVKEASHAVMERAEFMLRKTGYH